MWTDMYQTRFEVKLSYCFACSIVITSSLGIAISWMPFYRWENRFSRTHKWFLKVKIAFKMLTVRGKQHLFATPAWMLLWICRRSRDKNVSTWGGSNPNLRIHAEVISCISRRINTYIGITVAQCVVPCCSLGHKGLSLNQSKINIEMLPMQSIIQYCAYRLAWSCFSPKHGVCCHVYLERLTATCMECSSAWAVS